MCVCVSGGGGGWREGGGGTEMSNEQHRYSYLSKINLMSGNQKLDAIIATPSLVSLPVYEKHAVDGSRKYKKKHIYII